MKRELITLSVGEPKSFNWKGKDERSGIGKNVVSRAELLKSGFKNDGVANLDFHGGPDRAVCAYPFEHYSLWEAEFGRVFTPPAFGENICITNMKEDQVYIGDTFSLGETIIQVTQGRVPCSTISKFNQEDKLLSRILETGFTGYFFRVLQEGVITQEDTELVLVDRPQEKVTVLYANQIMFHDRKNVEGIRAILEVEPLAEVWRDNLNKMLSKIVE
ncbi:MOSC domain-containing protein [Bacillus sp. 31A1R]|uniref:MOSC domain-containing protein n=1 Tax=Robertmurraya mangrovi TaxID=3098077 RepID=A0ABU5J2X5_9BACI|nr:MOSC domain-containing protein [Bacillus sp. 31A1R]MDZ5473754.1 MOSC domain-containing protein [Bacillus sp. 31A1R]